jgi:23S rRNA pseudouridine1911/1915/1917 synthase
MSHKTLTVPPSIPFPARWLGSILQNLLAIPASHSEWLIENGCVAINRRICRRIRERLEPGDVLDIDWVPMPVAPPKAARKPSNRGPIEFLYDDPYLCVVNKPAGLLTVPTRYGEGQTLVSRVERRLKDADPKAEVFCVHRLDRDVSGVLVLAKSLDTAQALRNQFADRKPERKYIALIAGTMEPPSGTISSYLATDQDLNRYSVSDATQGELAITHYSTKVVWNDASLVEVRLETGRRNQIRVHLAEANHPILGDPRYRNDLATHRAWPHRRIALHAETLSLVHPVTGEPLTFQSSWPQEFRDFQRSASQKTKRRSGQGESHDRS